MKIDKMGLALCYPFWELQTSFLGAYVVSNSGVLLIWLIFVIEKIQKQLWEVLLGRTTLMVTSRRPKQVGRQLDRPHSLPIKPISTDLLNLGVRKRV